MLVDIYALVERSRRAIDAFFELFAQSRESSGIRFEDGTVIQSAEEALIKLLESSTVSASLYWRVRGDSKVEHAMLFFTGDGGMIVGVSVRQTDHDPTDAQAIADWLSCFASQLHATHGYALFESPPSFETISSFVGDLDVALLPKAGRRNGVPTSARRGIPWRGLSGAELDLGTGQCAIPGGVVWS